MSAEMDVWGVPGGPTVGKESKSFNDKTYQKDNLKVLTQKWVKIQMYQALRYICIITHWGSAPMYDQWSFAVYFCFFLSDSSYTNKYFVNSNSTKTNKNKQQKIYNWLHFVLSVYKLLCLKLKSFLWKQEMYLQVASVEAWWATMALPQDPWNCSCISVIILHGDNLQPWHVIRLCI